MLDRIDPKHLPVVLSIAKTRLRPFFGDVKATIELRAHAAQSAQNGHQTRPTTTNTELL